MSSRTCEPSLQLLCQVCESPNILQDDEPFSAILADVMSFLLVNSLCPVMSPTWVSQIPNKLLPQRGLSFPHLLANYLLKTCWKFSL